MIKEDQQANEEYTPTCQFHNSLRFIAFTIPRLVDDKGKENHKRIRNSLYKQENLSTHQIPGPARCVAPHLTTTTRKNGNPNAYRHRHDWFPSSGVRLGRQVMLSVIDCFMTSRGLDSTPANVRQQLGVPACFWTDTYVCFFLLFICVCLPLWFYLVCVVDGRFMSNVGVFLL